MHVSGAERLRARTRPLEATAMDLSGVKNRGIWDFPGGLCFRCRGHRFDPWLGKFHIMCSKQKKKKEWRHLDVSQVVIKMEHSQDDNRIQDGRTVCEPDVNIQRMRESSWIVLLLMMVLKLKGPTQRTVLTGGNDKRCKDLTLTDTQDISTIFSFFYKWRNRAER